MLGLNTKIEYGKPKMKIVLKNNIYFPGETINGNIYLQSGNFLGKGIIIYEIFGQEKLNEANKYNMECNYSTKIYHASLEYPGLINYSILKGITIPFEIALPPYILPSFEFGINNNNKNTYGYIKNLIQIEIPELNLMKQKFIIFRRPLTKLNSSLNFTAERNEKMFGIFNKGCPILSASYDKNYYFFGEEIPIKICFNNNNSKLKIKCINIKLIRNIVFKLKENNEEKKVEDITFSNELFNKNININEKMDMNNINQDIYFEEKIIFKEPENIFNKHSVDYLNLGLNDKSNLILFLPSFDSSLFKCEYYIKIEGIYDTIFPVSNLIIHMPISAYHNKEKRICENNEFNLFNFENENINHDENKNNKDEELIPKPGYNLDKENLQRKNSDNIKNNKIEQEVKTFRNDQEKAWNNITNGQILPEAYILDNKKEKK